MIFSVNGTTLTALKPIQIAGIVTAYLRDNNGSTFAQILKNDSVVQNCSYAKSNGKVAKEISVPEIVLSANDTITAKVTWSVGNDITLAIVLYTVE